MLNKRNLCNNKVSLNILIKRKKSYIGVYHDIQMAWHQLIVGWTSFFVCVCLDVSNIETIRFRNILVFRAELGDVSRLDGSFTFYSNSCVTNLNDIKRLLRMISISSPWLSQLNPPPWPPFSYPHRSDCLDDVDSIFVYCLKIIVER